MPASAAALARAGMPPDKGAQFANSAAIADAKLSWLGDVFAVPASWPLSNVFSLGDLVITIGLTIMLHSCAQSRLATRINRNRKVRRARDLNNAPTGEPKPA
jgi:hypothetical protein